MAKPNSIGDTVNVQTFDFEDAFVNTDKPQQPQPQHDHTDDSDGKRENIHHEIQSWIDEKDSEQMKTEEEEENERKLYELEGKKMNLHPRRSSLSAPPQRKLSRTGAQRKLSLHNRHTSGSTGSSGISSGGSFGGGAGSFSGCNCYSNRSSFMNSSVDSAFECSDGHKNNDNSENPVVVTTTTLIQTIQTKETIAVGNIEYTMGSTASTGLTGENQGSMGENQRSPSLLSLSGSQLTLRDKPSPRPKMEGEGLIGIAISDPAGHFGSRSWEEEDDTNFDKEFRENVESFRKEFKEAEDAFDKKFEEIENEEIDVD